MAIVGQVTYKKVSLQCVVEHLVSCQGRPVSQRNFLQVFHKVMVKSDMLYSSNFGHSQKRNSLQLYLLPIQAFSWVKYSSSFSTVVAYQQSLES